MRKGYQRFLTPRPRKTILKGVYYCPIVPELGHYENEGLWGYDKLVNIEKNKYRHYQYLFKTKEERDEAYNQEIKDIYALGDAMLVRRKQYIEDELDDLEKTSADTHGAYRVVEGRIIRLTV